MSAGNKYATPVVGDKVFVILGNRRNVLHEMEVVKVGKKFADIKGHGGIHRINLSDWSIKHDMLPVPGFCYPSKQAYQAEKELNDAWFGFVMNVRDRKVPDGVTVEHINQARVTLNLGMV